MHPCTTARSMLGSILLLLLVITAISCSWVSRLGADDGGKLAIRSKNDQTLSLSGNFTTAIYSFANKDEMTVLLLDGPIDQPNQAVTIRILWMPTAGSTPIDPTATNTSVEYIIFSGTDHQEIGIYSGAGYVFPQNNPGSEQFNAGFWQADLHLTDRSNAFKDLLGQASLKGRFSARHDDVALQQNLHKLDVLVAQKLGYPRLVQKLPGHSVLCANSLSEENGRAIQ